MERVLESHGPRESLELSKVQIGLENGQDTENETQIDTVSWGQAWLLPADGVVSCSFVAEPSAPGVDLWSTDLGTKRRPNTQAID